MTGNKKNRGDGGPRIFISKVTDSSGSVRKDAVKRGDKIGTYDITVLIGLDRDANFSVPVEVLANGEQIALLDVKERKEYPFKGLKPDDKDQIAIFVKRASDSADKGHGVVFRKTDLEKAKKTTTAHAQSAATGPQRLKVRVGRQRPDGSHQVDMETYDEHGQLEGAKNVIIDPGQEFILRDNMDNILVSPAMLKAQGKRSYTHTTTDGGRATIFLELLEADTRVPFVHEDSGEAHSPFLEKSRKADEHRTTQISLF